MAASPKKRIRFLYSDTGGGHKASALALKDALESAHPGKVECDMVDLFVEGGGYPFSDYPQIYKELAATPWLWKLVAFDFGASPFGILFNEWITELICYDGFRRLLAAAPTPDLVVSVHPLLNACPLKAQADLDGGQRTTPFATVVTDLGSAHPSWFDTGVDKCYVPTDALRKLAEGRRLSPSQIVQHGLPIRRGFWKGAADDDADRVRDALGLDQAVPTVLVVGGGDGMGGLAATAAAIGDGLGASLPGASQLVVVCGRNEAAVADLKARAWPSCVRAEILGFVDNMEQYMACSDLLVTKAGPGTIAEASAMGLPCVLSSFLPGQESGNVDFVEEAGFGAYRSEPTEIAELVVKFLSDGATMGKMSGAARSAARPEATIDIAKDLAKLAGVE